MTGLGAEIRAAVAGPMMLIAARARRRPASWLLPALGIALAVAFAGAVAAEGVIAGDQAARVTLDALTPLQRTVRVSWQGSLTPAVGRRARALLHGLHLDEQTEVVLLNPVRLSGVIVRPAAISPLSRWLPSAAAAAAGGLAPCRPQSCPMLQASGGHLPPALSTAGVNTASGVNIEIAGSTALRSTVPLAFQTDGEGQWPLLLTGDTAGLDALAGLSGVYRVHNWLAVLPVQHVHSWQLAGIEAQLDRAQASLQDSAIQFSLDAPFDELDAARTQASAAPKRLLLAGGGAAATLVLFIILSAAALRREQLTELQRLRGAGARATQLLAFVAGEAGLLTALALLAGAALAILTATTLATAAAQPAGAVLTRSLLSATGALALAGAWLAATALITTFVFAPPGRAFDVLAVAAGAALLTALDSSTSAAASWTFLLAPLCCLAAGVVVHRVMVVLLRAGERAARAGPVAVRLALTGLARAPSLPSLAIAFIAVSVGLSGFALAYRATLVRSAADQAADQVPLDALISPTPSFQTPLQIAPLAYWRGLAPGGAVLPVRRTLASYASGTGYITVPALGVPADGLALMHGWRAGDGSAPLRTLARRLTPSGPVRVPGPLTAPGARTLALAAASPLQSLEVSADLRDPQGTIRQLALGVTGGRRAYLHARLPPGRWEIEALELDEPAGLLATNGHQNAENAAAATQSQARVQLGPLLTLGAGGEPLTTVSLNRWQAVGAASVVRERQPVAAAHMSQLGDAAALSQSAEAAEVNFQTTGAPGIVRPQQPSDTRPLPVLADPQTTAAAGPGGRLALTVDELPVSARVVGVIRRFPTTAPAAAGVIVADQAALGSALDAQLPGQGAPDELWIATRSTARLRAALRSPELEQLGAGFRVSLERRLRAAPITRSVLGTLIAASALSVTLAVLGLLLALLGAFRDARLRSDLQALGLGPRALRAKLRARLAFASLLGVCAGFAIALLLTRFAVAAVGDAGAVAAPQPPLVTVIPVGALAALGFGTAAMLALAGWLATRDATR
ncbi:MAG: hypothetical protein ACLP8S_05110 [Solirubrobacteraceae bacterium]